MNKYFIFLEKLRRSGITNMFGAGPYLYSNFPEIDSLSYANKILVDWMNSYNDFDYRSIPDEELEEY